MKRIKEEKGVGGWLVPLVLDSTKAVLEEEEEEEEEEEKRRRRRTPAEVLEASGKDKDGLHKVTGTFTHPPTHPPNPYRPAAHSNRLILLHPPIHP